MSDLPNAAGGQPSEPRDDEVLIDRLRSWLRETRAAAMYADRASSDENAAGESSAWSDGGLFRLLEEFTALRHEIKLQTRSARGLEEAVAEILPSVKESIEGVRALRERPIPMSAGTGPAAGPATHAQFQSFALALAELDEALQRGRQQVARSIEMLRETPATVFATQLQAMYARQSWLARWFARSLYRELSESLELLADTRERDDLLSALDDGYGLIQQRLNRLMAKEDISRIATVGQPVDPEWMVVVEAVSLEGPPGVVVDEIRPGYSWKGKVLRYAEVRAIRSAP